MPYGQARRLPAPGVPSTDRLNLYPTPIADGTVIWTTPPGKTYTTHLPLRFGDFREAAIDLVFLHPCPRPCAVVTLL